MVSHCWTEELRAKDCRPYSPFCHGGMINIRNCTRPATYRPKIVIHKHFLTGLFISHTTLSNAAAFISTTSIRSACGKHLISFLQFVQEWYILTNVGCKAIIFCTNILVPQRMNHNNFGERMSNCSLIQCNNSTSTWCIGTSFNTNIHWSQDESTCWSCDFSSRSTTK